MNDPSMLGALLFVAGYLIGVASVVALMLMIDRL